MSETVLDRIVAAVRARLEATPPHPDLEQRALRAAEMRRHQGQRSLRQALGRTGPQVIAECKMASPSAGLLQQDFDPVALARTYEGSGAAAISVVTEPDFFSGQPAWLEKVREAVGVPVLRKDFVVCRRQILESVVLGADAVLLIQRILDEETMAGLLEDADRHGLEVLLEVFADEDPAPAVASSASIIGVNARDLSTMQIDLGKVAGLAGSIPGDRMRVAESGISSPQEILELSQAGYDAFLIGTHLVTASDPGVALQRLLGDRSCL